MYFGQTNSPATFQNMMDDALGPTIIKFEKLGTIIRVYMDDIGIATHKNVGLQGHIDAVCAVLQSP